MKQFKFVVAFLLLAASIAGAQPGQPKPADACFEKFQPLKAPPTRKMVLRKGDRLAICGDSITEQKMYSRILEDYLTVCVPDLEITARQYGWSGERARGFLSRMTNDCLRFKPTIATTCYGMNDHEYRPYLDRIGLTYSNTSVAIIEAFKANGARVIQGSPGCVGKMPSWVKSATGTVEDLNLSLCRLRNIGIHVAEREHVPFADVFWPMLTAGVAGQKRFGPDFAIAGKDGVHPGWAGQAVMAYAFLKAMGLNGDLGTFVIDLKRQKIKTSGGHQVLSTQVGEYEICSRRYPFCPCLKAGAASPYPVCDQDNPASDSSIRAALTLIPFNQELNRMELRVKNARAESYNVTWGSESKTFSVGQLTQGVNLAAEFPCNPFCDAFAKVDAAVAAKQAYETKQIKEIFRRPEAATDMAGLAARTEQERAPLAAAIKTALVPVTHKIKIEPN